MSEGRCSTPCSGEDSLVRRLPSRLHSPGAGRDGARRDARPTGDEGARRDCRKRPRWSRRAVAGTASTIVRPGSPPPWPALVFVNGATPDGRAHPMVLRLSDGARRDGPSSSTSPTCRASPAASCHRRRSRRSIDYVDAAADSGETAEGRVGLAGVSVGASLALLAAADPRLADRISVVACVAPYSDMANVMLLATTGMYRTRQGASSPTPCPTYLWVGLARSVTAILPPSPGDRGPDRRAAGDRPGRSRPCRAFPATARSTTSERMPRASLPC